MSLHGPHQVIKRIGTGILECQCGGATPVIADAPIRTHIIKSLDSIRQVLVQTRSLAENDNYFRFLIVSDSSPTSEFSLDGLENPQIVILAWYHDMPAGIGGI